MEARGVVDTSLFQRGDPLASIARQLGVSTKRYLFRSRDGGEATI